MKKLVGSALTLLLVACATSVDSQVRAPQGPPSEPWASPARELTLLNAYDAFGPAREGLRQDFGFSTVIRRGDVTILFDAGTRADVFEANMRALGVDLGEIDYAVASHSHHDHIAGFDVLLRENPDVQLFLPPDFFGLGAPIPFSVAGVEPGAGEALPKEQRYFGGEGDGKICIDSTGRFWNAKNVTYVSEPLEIAPGVRLIPTRSQLMGTFMRYPPTGTSLA